MTADYSKRLKIIGALILLSGLFFWSKLFWLQVVKGEEYRQIADRQSNRPEATTFDRGTIFLKEKDNNLVTVATVRELPGAPSAKWRFYPGGALAAHVIGLIGYNEDQLVGRYGLEAYYNDVLERGEPQSTFRQFLVRLFGDLDANIEAGTLTHQGDLITTIEPSVQRYLERELAKAAEKWQPKTIGGVVMDPKTGRIVALAARPNFEPAQPISDLGVLTNPLVENVYEVGSIIKPLTLAAALDANAITPETTYFDAGYLTLDGRRINNHDRRGRGQVSMQEVLNYSLNTGAVYAMQQISEQRFAEYLAAFGLGERSGIDLPNETVGLLGNLLSKRSVELATASFGQGIAVSPIAVTRALSALAGGGLMPSPYIVESIRYLDGLEQSTPRREAKRVISEASAHQITQMLVTAVDQALAGGTKKLERYQIAAKTGTAQIPRTDGQPGYKEDKYLHSFFGYFPASDPKFIVFLFQVEPEGAFFSSDTLTEPFMSLAKFLLNYYQIPPDR